LSNCNHSFLEIVFAHDSFSGVYGYFHTTTGKLDCDRKHRAHKDKKIYSLGLYRKYLLDPVLRQKSVIFSSLHCPLELYVISVSPVPLEYELHESRDLASVSIMAVTRAFGGT
jgi:hypothetical protein